jgi:hypothetical protein
MHHYAEIGYTLVLVSVVCFVWGVAINFAHRFGGWRVPRTLGKSRTGGWR